MQDYAEPTSSPTPMKSAAIVMIVVAAMIVGASSGILIADRDALHLLKKSFASQLTRVGEYLGASGATASAKPETTNVIPAGRPSIVAIHYSSKPGSTHVTFDLQSADLVRTGKLRNP